jgi:hypothetical protein
MVETLNTVMRALGRYCCKQIFLTVSKISKQIMPVSKFCKQIFSVSKFDFRKQFFFAVSKFYLHL